MNFSDVFKNIKIIAKALRRVDSIAELSIHSEIERIKCIEYKKSSKTLIPYGSKIYSQNEEDGIIREIFNRIGLFNRVFVEIGVGNGLENNTSALLLDGWSGLWMDCNKNNAKAIRKGLFVLFQSGVLTFVHEQVTTTNVNKLILKNGICGEIDLLSIDIDGNDAHLFDAITSISPRCVVIEYNAKFGPCIEYCMPYDPKYSWHGGDDAGASLAYLERLVSANKYALVGCNLTGSNAFFVREDLLGDLFFSPSSVVTHYQPFRQFLSGYRVGHQSTYTAICANRRGS